MFCCGKAVNQLQMHLKGGVGLSAASSSPEHSDGLLAMNSEETYRIATVCIDHERDELAPVGVAPIYDTGCPFPAFDIMKPAVTNTRVDMSPYGQSVVADAVDAVQAVDLTFDAHHVRRLHHSGCHSREGTEHARSGCHHGGLGVPLQVIRRGEDG